MTRKDRAKRLLLSLAMKHNPQNQSQNQSRHNALINVRGGGGEAGGGGVSGGASVPATASSTGGGQVVVSPLVTATDSATVRPGMVLATVSARSGQGVSQEAVDTLGMGVKEAIETLVRWEFLAWSVFNICHGVRLRLPPDKVVIYFVGRLDPIVSSHAYRKRCYC